MNRHNLRFFLLCVCVCVCVCVSVCVCLGILWFPRGVSMTRGGCWVSSAMGDLGLVDSCESWAKCEIRILPLASDCT